MRTFTCRSTFLYDGTSTVLIFSISLPYKVVKSKPERLNIQLSLVGARLAQLVDLPGCPPEQPLHPPLLRALLTQPRLYLQPDK